MHVCVCSLPTVNRELVYSWLTLKTFFLFLFWMLFYFWFYFLFVLIHLFLLQPSPPIFSLGLGLCLKRHTHTHTHQHSPFIERLVFCMVDLKYTEILNLAEAETLIPMSSPGLITTTFLLLGRFELSFREFKMLYKYHPLKIPQHF